MTYRRSAIIGVLFAVFAVAAVAGWWWYKQFQTPPFRIAMLGSACKSGDLGMSGGNLFVVAPKPGIFFGTVKKPGSQEQFTYVVLFKYSTARSDYQNQSIRSSSGSEGRKTHADTAIELNGKRLEARYEIELTDTLKGVANESLLVGGKTIDLTSGRVFLLDLASATPVYDQKNLELPSIHGDLNDPIDVEMLAMRVFKSLAEKDPEIKAFLR